MGESKISTTDGMHGEKNAKVNTVEEKEDMSELSMEKDERGT
jgi:hypothetical protein